MSSSGETGSREASDLLANVWRLIQSVMDEAEPEMNALGLSPKAYFLMETIGEHPFPAELSRRLHLPPPTVTYLIKQMESRGFLERRAEAGDLRKFRLVRTPSGMDALERGREAYDSVMGRRLRRLDSGELDWFNKTVKRLAAPDHEET